MAAAAAEGALGEVAVCAAAVMPFSKNHNKLDNAENNNISMMVKEIHILSAKAA